MALELLAGLGFRIAVGLLKQEVPALHDAGFLVDAVNSTFSSRVYDMFKRRLDPTSPFGNHDLQRALRAAYLRALQRLVVDYQFQNRQRYPNDGVSLNEIRSWLEALSLALAAELAQTSKLEYLPPPNSVTKGIETILSPGDNSGDYLEEDIENALLKELKAELNAKENHASNLTFLGHSVAEGPVLSIFAARFIEEKKKRGLEELPMPAEFWNSVKGGNWLELVTAFFANTINSDERIYRIYTSEILSSLARRPGTEDTLASAKGIRELINAKSEGAERQLRELKDMVVSLVENSASQSTDLGRLANLLEGLRSLFESSSKDQRELLAIAMRMRETAGGAGKETANPAKLTEEEYSLIRRSYLTWLRNEFKILPGELKLHEQPVDLPLDKVYVSVRGYPGSASEIQQAKTFQEQGEDRYVEPSSWLERDRPPHLAAKWVESIDLGEAFRRHQATVILGEPGSGKSTLARWLTLAFANSCWNGDKQVLVAQKAIDAGVRGPDQIASLGETRLPIFLRIADIAEAYQTRRHNILADLLGFGESIGFPVYLSGESRKGDRIMPEQLTPFFKQALREEGAVLILDGLDEIANPDDRREIVKLIHSFLDSPLMTPTASGKSNQLLVTSRIIGYDIHPLRDAVVPYTIERLSARAISAFSDSWHSACAPKLASQRGSLAETARTASDAFKNQIIDAGGSALRELASNAFMLSLLCVLNEEHHQRLPTSRAKLYEALVDRGLRGLFVEKTDANRQLGELVRRLLMVVAHHMHTTTSNGLLPAIELKDTVWKIVEQDAAARKLITSSDNALGLIVEGTGLLVERGVGQRSTRQYGFKHQTVQEFLAGRLLVDDVKRAVPNLLRRSADPRWREAVLLGLGYLCESLPAAQLLAVCRELLLAQTGFVPTGAIILAQLVNDRPSLPDVIVTESVVRLLEAYGQPGVLRDQARFRELVESFVASLLTKTSFPQSWRTAAERGCLQFAKKRPAENVRILAGLLHKCRVATPSFVETLLAALHDDRPESDWILNRALEMTAVSDQLTPPPSSSVNGEACAKLADKTKQTLRNRLLIDTIRFLPASPRWADHRDTTGIPPYLLPFREALEESPEFLTQIEADIGWLKLVIALYGGLGSFETPDLRRSLNDGRSTLGSSVIDDQEAARTAAYLDTAVQPQWDRFKSRTGTLNPKWIYRDSPLTPVLIRRLRQHSSIVQVVAELRDIWSGRDATAVRTLLARYRETPSGRSLENGAIETILLTDCLVALLCADAVENHPATSPLQATTPAQKQALYRFVSEPSRILAAGRDPVLRFRVPLEQAVARCAKQEAPTPPVSSQPISANMTPQNPEPEWHVLPEFSDDAAESARQLGDFWELQLSAKEPDPNQRLSIILDIHGKTLSARAGVLFLSWQFLVSSPWCSRQAEGLEEACLRSTDQEVDSLFVRCMAGIARLPDNCEFLKAFAISRLLPLFEKAPPLKMLALSQALKLRQPQHRHFVLATLLGSQEYDEAKILAEIKKDIDAIGTNFPIEAFHTLRYLSSPERLSEPAGRNQLLSAALVIPSPKARAVALAQTAHKLQSSAEGDAASSALTSLLATLEETADLADLRAFAKVSAPIPGAPDNTPDVMNAWRALTALAAELQVDPPCSLELIGTRSAEENAELVAYYFRYLFVCENDDREYSIAVVLDTVGKKLNLPPPVAISAFSRSLGLVAELNWDALTSLPSGSFESQDGRQEMLNALLFLWSIPDGFDFFVAWGLSRINSFIRLTSPDLVPFAAVVAGRVKELFRPIAFSGMDERWVKYSAQDFTAAIRSEALAIADPFFRFNTLRILRHMGVSDISCAALMNAAATISDSAERGAALRDFVVEFSNEIFLEGLQKQFYTLLSSCDPQLRGLLIFLLALTAPNREALSENASTEPEQNRLGHLRIVLRKSIAEQEASASRESKLQAVQWLEANASSIDKSEQRAGLAAALVCLRCAAIAPALVTTRKDSLWRQLSDPAHRAEVIATLVAAGRNDELELGSEGIEALTDWIARGEPLDPLEPILALLSRGVPGATPVLEEWFRKYPQSALGRWACLMLAERNRWTVDVAKSLTELLQYPGDLLRNRAVMAFTFKAAKRGFARASIIGRDVVVEMADVTLRTESLPHGVLLTAVWAFESLIIDTPGLLTNLRDQYVAGKNSSARALYRLISYTSDVVAQEVLALLKGSLPVPLRAALTRGIISLWTRSWHLFPKNSALVTAVRQILWHSLQDDNTQISRYAADALGFIGEPEDIRTAAERVRQKSPLLIAQLNILAANALEDPSPSLLLLQEDPTLSATLFELSRDIDPEVCVAAGAFLLRSRCPAEEIRRQMRNDNTFLLACFASIDTYFVGDKYRTQIRNIARSLEKITSAQIEAHGVTGADIFTAALRSADELMQAARWRSQEVQNRSRLIGNVLPVCSAMAEMMPDLYRRVVWEFLPEKFSTRLEVASLKADYFTTRESAVVLLALLRKFSEPLSHALQSVCADVFPVQQTVIRQIDRVHEIDPAAFQELETLLMSESANVVYAASRIIVNTLQNERIDSEERESLRNYWIAALSRRAESVNPYLLVSVLESGDDRFVPRIRNVALLKDVLQSALVELSAIYQSRRLDDSREIDLAQMKVRIETQGEPRSLELWLGEYPADDSVPNQRVWLQKSLGVQFPQDLNEALSDLAKVSKEASVSCAALADQAQYS